MSKTVLCAIDINRPKEERRVLETALRLAELDGAQLDVITVVPDFGSSVVGAYLQDHHVKTAKDDAGKTLKAFCDDVLGTDTDTRVRHLVAVGSVYGEVLHAANINEADLIVIGAHRPDFKDYLLLCPRTQADVAITGCKVVQNLRALNGAQARGKTAEATYGRNSHNFFRGGGRRLYVTSNDIFVRHGWSSGVLYDNHALRLNRHDARGMRAVVARNHIEGMITRRSKGGAVPMNMLIEQNYIVANPMTRPALSFHGGAASIRNNIVVEHATARQPRGGAGFRSFVSFDWDGTVRATGQMPFLIHHNSFILLRKNAAPEIVFQKDNPLPHVLIGNNLVWAEHMGDPEGVWPLDTTSLGWDARYRGARLGWAGLRDQTLPRTLRAGDAVTVPYWTDMLGWDLSQTDFAGEAGRHVIEVAIGGKRAKFDAQRGEAQFAFLPDGVRITNRSGRPWPKGAGFRLHCDRGTTPSPMQTAYGHPPGTLSLYRPQPGSSAWQSGDSAMWWPHDFLGRIRPSAASKGAVEPS